MRARSPAIAHDDDGIDILLKRQNDSTSDGMSSLRNRYRQCEFDETPLSPYLDESGQPCLRASIVGFLDLLGFSQLVISLTEPKPSRKLPARLSLLHDLLPDWTNASSLTTDHIRRVNPGVFLQALQPGAG